VSDREGFRTSRRCPRSECRLGCRDRTGAGEDPEYVAERLSSAGFEVSVHEYGEGHQSVVAVYGRPETTALCFSGHLDTVAVIEDECSVDPYGGRISNGRLSGRGSVDMKAGVGAMLHAVEQYARDAPADAPPLVLLLTAEEELGCLGASALADAHASGRLVIGEPTSNRPLLGHRGAVWLDLEAEGRSCHASTPHLGENAILKLIACLSDVEAWVNPSVYQDLGDRTLNVGRVAGGVMRNIVPSRRSRSSTSASPRADVTALPEVPVLALAPVWSDADDPWIAAVTAIARERGGEVSGAPSARFFTDARYELVIRRWYDAGTSTG
jgi:succinyl-diaminopimelate desuccinylase